MKIKSLFFSLVLLALGGSLSAQTLTPAGSSTGSITTNAANCNTTNACIILHLASSNVGYSATVSGTWTGTLTVEQSGDNQGSWTSATTTTANTLYTSALTPGITDVRVRGSAAMTGTAVVTITASGPATLQQVAGGSSSSSSLSKGVDAVTFGVKADTLTCFAASVTWTNASKNVSCATANFTSADVGKIIFGTNGCCGLAANVGSVVQLPQSTIQSITNSTTVVVSGAAANATSGVNAILVWGSDDTVPLNNAWAVASGNVCTTLILPPGSMLVSSLMFSGQSVNCNKYGAATNGGVGVIGWGYNSSTIIPVPNWIPTGASCASGNGCFFNGTAYLVAEDFSIWGAGNSLTGNVYAGTLVNVALGSLLSRVGVSGWGASLTNSVGTLVTNGATFDAVIDGAGQIACEVGGTLNVMQLTFCGDTQNSNLVILAGSGVKTFQNQYGLVNGNGAIVWNQGGTLWASQDNFVSYGAALNMYRIDAGGINYMDKINAAPLCSGCNNLFLNGGSAFIRDSQFGNTGSNNAILVNNAASVLHISGSTVTGAAGANAITTVAGSKVFDEGNTWSGPIVAAAGTFSADGHSLKGICTGVATASQTLGLYGTGSNVTVTTCTSTTIGGGIPVAGARTAQNLTVSVTAAGTNASSGVVTVLKNGVATTITCTIGTGTSCTDGTHTAAFADGDLISIQFTTQAADTLAGVKAFVDWN